ncbi:glucoamylase family protein [Caldicellulosiruptoraceae bacterium PP1]
MLLGNKLLELELKKSFDFFWNEANSNENNLGYGLIKDRYPTHQNIASIASVGFSLTAYIIGVERGYVDYQSAYKRTAKTLDTVLNNLENINGFYYHFVDMNTGKRIGKCEISVIDTAILLCGAIAAGEYFGGEIKEKAETLYARTNWKWYTDPNKNYFYMGYSPERGFEGYWDMCAEQFMMYFLGFASPTYPVDPSMFYTFRRNKKSYNGLPEIYHSPGGSLFVYQFSFAWFDLRNMVDNQNVNWWENSKYATLSNRQYCIDYQDKFKTFGPNSWGLTACDGPNGYSGSYGAPPKDSEEIHLGNDGTVPPCGSAGSIVFTPDESISALENFYNNFPKLWGIYGFKDSFNLENDNEWYATDVIGIDKGITIIMIENYLSGLIWDIFMKNKYVKKGIELAGLRKINDN